MILNLAFFDFKSLLKDSSQMFTEFTSSAPCFVRGEKREVWEASVKLLLGTLLLRLQYAIQSAVYRVCTVPTRDSQDCVDQGRFWMNV